MQSTLGKSIITGGFVIYGTRKKLVVRAKIARTNYGSEVHTLISVVRMGQLLEKLVLVVIVLSHSRIILEGRELLMI